MSAATTDSSPTRGTKTRPVRVKKTDQVQEAGSSRPQKAPAGTAQVREDEKSVDATATRSGRTRRRSRTTLSEDGQKLSVANSAETARTKTSPAPAGASASAQDEPWCVRALGA